jgi:DNA helicase-2/ATP-dependent DNA helicase PcrA
MIVRKGGFRTAPVSASYDSYATQTENVHKKKAPITEFSSVSSVSTKKSGIDVSRGDMVEHTAFGRGLVLSVIPMGGDALLEVAFDKVGTKKLMKNAASAHMKRL